MPTDAALVFERKTKASQGDAAAVRDFLLLIPVAFCLFSILLAVEFPAFAAAIAMMGTE